jgi:signal transduction histidine kinase
MPASGVGERAATATARVLLVGGTSWLRAALPLELPDFQVVLAESLPDCRRSLSRRAPALILVAAPVDIAQLRDVDAFRQERPDVPVVAVAQGADEAAALAVLDDELRDVVLLDDDGALPLDLSERLTRLLPRGAAEDRIEERAEPPQDIDVPAQRLRERTFALERIVESAASLRDATTREDLAERVLRVLSTLPGFGLVAVCLQDERHGATEIRGMARMSDGTAVPLGRRMLMLDLLGLAGERRCVSRSHVLAHCSVDILEDDAADMAPEAGGWSLADILDGSDVGLTPIQLAGRAHAWLLVKAPTGSGPIEEEGLRPVELLAHLAAVAFDGLIAQEVRRRRQALMGRVHRLGHALISVRDAEAVLAKACEALAGALDGAIVTATRVRSSSSQPVVLQSPRIFEVGPDDAPRAFAGAAASQLLIPVRVNGGVRALVMAMSSRRGAFAQLDPDALELFSEVVAKALAGADALAQDRLRLEHLRLIAQLGRIATSSLESHEVLATALHQLCQHGAYEIAGVLLVDRERGKLLEVAQASRAQGRVVDGISMPLSDGITGAVAMTGVPLRVDDVTKEPRYACVEVTTRSELCVPLRVLDEVIGVLNVESRQVGAFGEEDVVVLTAVADHLAQAVANARLYAQVTQKNRQLADSERNKTELLAIVAHDLRTPLTSIRSAADVVLMYRDEPAEVTDEFLKSIRDEAARLGRLVDDFLMVSRMEVGMLEYHVEDVDLPEIAAHFVRMFEGPAAQKRQTLACQIPADLPLVLADRERLAQVLSNLLSNATRCTPDGGRIEVTARVLPAPPGACLGKVQVDVADDGPGIEESHRERIFDKFVRLDGAAGGGAGLGLPIARAILESLGGRLWFEPRDGGGSRFCLTLPARLRDRM